MNDYCPTCGRINYNSNSTAVVNNFPYDKEILSRSVVEGGERVCYKDGQAIVCDNFYFKQS